MAKNGNIWTLCDKLVPLGFVCLVIAAINIISANLEMKKGWIR